MAMGKYHEIVLAVDPGRSKCGYAVVQLRLGESDPSVIISGISLTPEIGAEVSNQLLANSNISLVVIGNGTNSSSVIASIKASSAEIEVITVDEHGTSEAARALHLSRTPPQGIEKLLPNSLRSPKSAYDNVVAEIIGRNFLESQQKNLQQ